MASDIGGGILSTEFLFLFNGRNFADGYRSMSLSFFEIRNAGLGLRGPGLDK